DYSESYWLRWRTMALETGLPTDELALRFVAYAPGVHSCIVGTRNPEHLAHNLELLAKGPLPEDIRQALTERFAACGADWQSEL
ncbi:MAG TPA: aldo/keto reductase, partial [Candidatus Obscuribacterales bacterium]